MIFARNVRDSWGYVLHRKTQFLDGNTFTQQYHWGVCQKTEFSRSVYTVYRTSSYLANFTFAFHFAFAMKNERKTAKNEKKSSMKVMREMYRFTKCILYMLTWWEWAKMLTHFTQLCFNEKERNCQSYVQKRQLWVQLLIWLCLYRSFDSRVYHLAETETDESHCRSIESTLHVHKKRA